MDVVIIADIYPLNIWTRTVGAFRLASYCRGLGFSVKVLYGLSDFEDHHQRRLLNHYISSDTKLVALSSTFMFQKAKYSGIDSIRNFYKQELLSNLKELKDVFSHIPFIVGGANSQSEEFKFFDHVAFGFGEEVFYGFLKDPDRLIPMSQVIGDRNYYKSGNADFVDSFETLYNESDNIHNGETLTIEVSRGCRFKCKFCSYPLNGRLVNTYLKSTECLKREFLENYQKYQITNYVLADDTFNESEEKLSHFLSTVEALPFKINYTGYLRLDLMAKQEPFWDRLAKSGLRGVFFGIESLNDKAAQCIGKGFGAVNTKNTLMKLKKVWGQEVTTSAGFIVGLPFEDSGTIEAWTSELLSKDFPLDVKSFEPLYINSKASLYAWKSQFQMESEKYGYELSEKDGAPFWTSEHFTFNSASELADKLNRKSLSEEVQANFGSFKVMMLMGLGLTFDEARSLRPLDSKSTQLINSLTQNRITAHLKKELDLLQPELRLEV